MRIAIAQLNPTVGDIEGNTALILDALERSRSQGADLMVTPELAVFGYPPKDLLRRHRLIERNVKAVKHIAERCVGIAAAVGYVEPDPEPSGPGVFNAAAFCRDGTVSPVYRKVLLPTYDVFDEARYFNAGQGPCVVQVPTAAGTPVRVGLTICEDLWHDQLFQGRRVYDDDPIARTVAAGAELIVNLSASPYRAGICDRREQLFIHQVRAQGVPLVYVNLVGGNDDLVFDGTSVVIDASGRIAARATAFAEDLMIVEIEGVSCADARIEPYPERIDSIRRALVLGIRDYLHKCGFGEVLLGLSGGIDSAVTAALAVEALGSDQVHGVAMPSRFSSAHSIEDARTLAENLGIRFSVLAINDLHSAFEQTLDPHFEDRPPDVTEENVQARIRGTVLMAFSNKFNRVLLTTGNKSEIAVGYCTLYGDMCGGLAVLSDVPKTQVYQLAELINRTSERKLIPQRTIDKPPSAELREDQTDQDSLPSYDVLDAILEQYIELDRDADEIVGLGFDRDVVMRVTRLVDRNEYKRKQIPVGIKVTSRAFGTGRRMPIAARYQ